MQLHIKMVKSDLSIVKLKPGTTIGLPAKGFYCFLQTLDETTVVCDNKDVPSDALEVNSGWSGFKVQGPLDFSLTGIMAELAAILARDRISLYAISTYATDWILVKSDKTNDAAEAWRRAGHWVE